MPNVEISDNNVFMSNMDSKKDNLNSKVVFLFIENKYYLKQNF